SRDLCAVDRLVHEQEITRQQRALHAARRNLKCFDEEGANDEEENERHAQRSHPVIEPPRETRTAWLGRRGERRWGGRDGGGDGAPIGRKIASDSCFTEGT